MTQDLHFFRSERLYISGWLTLPVVLADRATAAIWLQGMEGRVMRPAAYTGVA